MGNSISMTKTPQAKDDFAATSEDSAIAIDVLANDLGGNAKSLYSLDQSNPLHVATTALSQFGATVAIVDGKIFYDPTGSAQLQALGSGQTVVDTFSYAIRLGNGTLSLATVSVTVNGANEAVLNHAPLLAGPIADQSVAEDHAVSFTLPPNTFTDADHDALTYTSALMGGAPLPSWLHFDAATQTFSGMAPQDFNGFFDIRVTASDGTLSASDDFRLTIAPVNDAPVLVTPIADRSFAEDTSVSFALPPNTFTDVDNAALIYSAILAGGGALPSWLHFDAATRTFSGTPPQDFNGFFDVRVTASDGTLAAFDDFRLTIAPVNDAPALATPIADRSFAEDTAVNFALPAGTFTDPDNDALTYTATLVGGAPLPLWLHFDTATRTFSGNPPPNLNGFLDIRVTASDGTLSAFDDFRLTITPVNDEPVFAAPVLGDPVIDENAGTGNVSGTVSFTDADLTDMHTITVIPGSATGYAGTFTAVQHTDSTNGMTGLVDLNFFVTFAEVQALGPGQHPQTYTIVVNDGHGGTDTTEVTIPLGGGDSPNHDPVITVVPPQDSAFTSVADNATQSILFRQGRLSFGDVDTQDTHFVNAVGNSGPSGTWGQLFVNVNHDTTGSGTGGIIGWQYQVAEQGRVRALGAGETHFDKFDVMLNDNHGGFAMQTVTVRIDGANDAPVVQQDTLVANISGSFTDIGGPVALQFAQGINFFDFDVHDAHTASAVLDLAHSTVNPDGILSVQMHDTLNGLGGRLDWTYDLHDTSMPHTPGHEGEQRKLTYNVTIDDGHGGVTVPFVITFNSPPVIQGTPLLSHIDFQENPNTPAWNFADNIAFTDVDPSDHHAVSWAFDQGHSSPGVTAPIGDLSLTWTDTTNGTGGLAHWDYHIDQSKLGPMTAADTRVEAFTFSIDDGHGGIAMHQLTVTIHGFDIV